jgi:hypothetical protein
MHEMKLTKGRDGWSAETKIALGITKRDDFGKGELPLYLVISTWKSSSFGLYSSASVHAESSGSVMMDVFGDFSKTIARDKNARCTEKTVRAMHQRALAGADALVAEALAFYAKKKVEESAGV